MHTVRLMCHRALSLGIAVLMACILMLSLALPAQADDDAWSLELPDISADLFAPDLAEDELDTVVGIYTYQGETYEITAREAIEDSVSLSSVANDDGTYEAPTADMILSYARNQILLSLADEAGITVSEDELLAYADENLGTDDLELIGLYYDMDADQVHEIIWESAMAAKLRDEVVGTIDTAPLAPMAPSTSEEAETPSEEYADYIIELVGDAWDAEAQEWTDENNIYCLALASGDFDGETATYTDAQTAYYLAYTLYQQELSDQYDAWIAYMNTYLGEATITIGTLRS